MYLTGLGSISPQDTFDTYSPEKLKACQSNRLNCIEPDFKAYIDAGMRRRMSRMVKIGVTAALKCLKDADNSNPDAIITATGLGCMADTENFINAIVDHNESLLNPTAFIQSTFNTVGAQIALILKNHNFNFTYVHRGFSLESALIDAQMQLTDNEASHLLVGSIDELTDNSFSMMQRMGFWKNGECTPENLWQANTRGSVAGEGSQFFMLSQQPALTTYACINEVDVCYKPAHPDEIILRIKNLLQRNELQTSDIDLLLTGTDGDVRYDGFYNTIEQQLFTHTPIGAFKHLCGEYHTASGFALWLTAQMLKNGEVPEVVYTREKRASKLKNILIYNNFQNINHSLMLVSAC